MFSIKCPKMFFIHRKIQSVFEMSDGSGLAVTVARYETPDHIDINKVLYHSTCTNSYPFDPLPARHTLPLNFDCLDQCRLA